MHLGHDKKSLMKWLHALLFVALPPQMFLVTQLGAISAQHLYII